MKHPLRLLISLLFLTSGTSHLLFPAPFQKIIPPSYPAKGTLVLLSGLAEIAGVVGLQIPPLRRPAGYGLITLLLAVFPANLYMASHPTRFPSIPPWLLYARLPLQPLLIAFVYSISRPANSDLTSRQ